MSTAARTNTTRIVLSVPDGAAACATVSEVGSMYDHCATPHPMTTDATAATESRRATRADPRRRSTSEPTPHKPEMITSGSAREVSPSKRYFASE